MTRPLEPHGTRSRFRNHCRGHTAVQERQRDRLDDARALHRAGRQGRAPRHRHEHGGERGGALEIGEQLEVLRRCKVVLGGDCPLVSGLYVTHTAAARELAPRLVDAGADAIVVFPPVPAFMGAVSIAMIEDYHGAVAEAVDVPLLAFQTNFANYPKGAITALSRIPQVVSIKDASFDMDQTISNLTEAIAAPRKIGILTGSDTFILEAMLMGCDGALVGFAATRDGRAGAHAGTGGSRRDHRGLRDLAQAGAAGQDLLAQPVPRLSRAHEIRAHAPGRHSVHDRACAVPDARRRGPGRHRPRLCGT
ncbi:MAG: dihydrodipicolinate synthase family protein [Betaproteobacteria bacterium]|nr:dihydrodipicolinate synthase family protein [Betaproteobacteria bacterium]